MAAYRSLFWRRNIAHLFISHYKGFDKVFGGSTRHTKYIKGLTANLWVSDGVSSARRHIFVQNLLVYNTDLDHSARCLIQRSHLYQHLSTTISSLLQLTEVCGGALLQV